jgi:hypothetical protein
MPNFKLIEVDLLQFDFNCAIKLEIQQLRGIGGKADGAKIKKRVKLEVPRVQ